MRALRPLSWLSRWLDRRITTRIAAIPDRKAAAIEVTAPVNIKQWLVLAWTDLPAEVRADWALAEIVRQKLDRTDTQHGREVG